MKSFPLSKQIVYALGMMGWSMMVNLIGVMLVYFYLPPSNSGLNMLISQRTFLVVFNLMAIITASGRLLDAFYDPFIARKSDMATSKRGRRIPFMIYSVLPAMLFCILIFYPPVAIASRSNAIWLIVVLSLFFVATTTYVIPYNALLPELAATTAEKIRLSSFQQVGFVVGIIISSRVNNIADWVGPTMGLHTRVAAVQYAVIFLSIIAAIAMLIPAFAIDEKKYCHSTPSSTPLMLAIKESFQNRNFKYFLFASFSYFTALNLITNGILYYVTVLCGIPESEGANFMGFMVIISLMFYPLVNILVKKTGQKKMMIFSFFVLSISFVCITLLGKLPFSSKAQLYILLCIAAFPLASLGILPNAILAEIAADDVAESGDNREGMYFAVSYFSAKMGQTIGIALFAMLTIYGKDPGHDLGLRMGGICGFVLCIVAGIIFRGFKEKKVST
ncbi:MAG TPA: MFS transporter [Bacteroidia bacterium]|nr:MFS transporter [Bacteroidia bacterium]